MNIIYTYILNHGWFSPLVLVLELFVVACIYIYFYPSKLSSRRLYLAYGLPGIVTVLAMIHAYLVRINNMLPDEKLVEIIPNNWWVIYFLMIAFQVTILGMFGMILPSIWPKSGRPPLVNSIFVYCNKTFRSIVACFFNTPSLMLTYLSLVASWIVNLIIKDIMASNNVEEYGLTLQVIFHKDGVLHTLPQAIDLTAQAAVKAFFLPIVSVLSYKAIVRFMRKPRTGRTSNITKPKVSSFFT